MNVINLCCYGEGNYSGAKYEENIAISQDAYTKFKPEIDALEVYLGELDGKHSCVYGEVAAQLFTEEEILNAGFDETYNDGDALYCQLEELFKSNGVDLDNELKMVDEYIDSLDLIVDVTVRVKSSKAEKVREFASALN